MEDTRWK